MSDRCKKCGACKECGAQPPQMVPYPVYPYIYPVYPLAQPYRVYPSYRPTWGGGANSISPQLSSGTFTSNGANF